MDKELIVFGRKADERINRIYNDALALGLKDVVIKDIREMPGISQGLLQIVAGTFEIRDGIGHVYLRDKSPEIVAHEMIECMLAFEGYPRVKVRPFIWGKELAKCKHIARATTSLMLHQMVYKRLVEYGFSLDMEINSTVQSIKTGIDQYDRTGEIDGVLAYELIELLILDPVRFGDLKTTFDRQSTPTESIFEYAQRLARPRLGNDCMTPDSCRKAMREFIAQFPEIEKSLYVTSR